MSRRGYTHIIARLRIHWGNIEGASRCFEGVSKAPPSASIYASSCTAPYEIDGILVDIKVVAYGY